ncbi:MAG: hypothetical protein JWO87_3454 [Phycisphaerales bacterium]|nr:hypothetical protein [Phycisphaerales bacterium]MDB5301791.1 hypothetical protein [Phycisphaerales bacterium]MDB5304474.1 hypothetical protein [Phycisphaerales bacterium]
MNHYANITLQGPEQSGVVEYLKGRGDSAFVATGAKGVLVVFHEDLFSQEHLAARLSAKFSCPALLVMGFGPGVLLYHLYQAGEQVDAYVSSPHEGLELAEPVPPGDAAILCAAFAMERAQRRVESILRKEGKPGQPYEYAVNRHGELLQALGLPLFAAGTSFAAIEMGDLPAGGNFDPTGMQRAG